MAYNSSRCREGLVATRTSWVMFLLACCSSWNSWCSASECPSACFCDTDSQYVSCVGDSTWKVPQTLPAPSERLELRNFAVDTLTKDIFNGLVALRELKLQQSQTRSIDDGALMGLAMLQRLDLSQNLLENLTSGTFRGLQQMKYLDLSSNQLVHIDGAFSDLGNLEQVNLRGNCLTQLSTYTFTGLLRAQYLNLDSNLISSIEVDAFQDLTNLAHLILSNNPLTTLSRLDFFGSRLQYIDASHVGLTRVPQSLTRFVRDLRLSRNNITKITLGDLDSYPHLGLLVLDDNAIEDVEDDALGRQEYLARLWLNGNKLRKIPLHLPSTLIALYIEENSISAIASYSFRGLTHLEQLFLQRNQIKTLGSCAFCDLINLRTLDLQANLIESIEDETFTNLTNLQVLDISQNPIKVLQPYCFSHLERLHTLQMSRLSETIRFEDFVFDSLKNLTILEMYDSSVIAERIVNSTRALHGLRNVQELSLVHNKLSYLRSDFPSFLPKLKVLKISGNSFHCDRKIRWLTRWMQTSSVQFYSSYSIRCATPPALQYKPVMLLTENDFSEASTAQHAVPTVVFHLSTEVARNVNEATAAANIPTVPIPQPLRDSKAETAPIHPPSAQPKTSTRSPINTTEEAQPSSLVKTTAQPIQVRATTARIAAASTVDRDTTGSENAGVDQLTGHEETSTHGDMTTLTVQLPSTQRLESTKPQESFASSSTENPVHSSSVQTISVSKMKPTEELQNSAPLMASTTSPLSTTEQATTEETQRTWSGQGAALVHLWTENPKAFNHTNNGAVPMVSGFFVSKAHAHVSDVSPIALASTATAVCCFLLIGVLAAATITVQMRHRCFWCRKHYSRMRRSSSISYRPQRDEVNILTVSEGTVGVRTSTHTEIGNKLYYVMENRDGVLDAMLEPHLQELVPQPLTENQWRSNHVAI
ncbi:insulin-like growth factor-binding protein complex acid labile subunit [Ornithodoros turicata]|uniref:insulin-like growth factor-binding protein complex acid labile subunit n=1 Tax=Ornithodoros turicata TaxID=34597 RepID=UPI003139B9A9